MKDLTVGNEAFVVESDHQLVSNERVIIELKQGCVWIPLFLRNERAGIAFVGASHFAVDAIAETDEGAVGESVSGTLGGIQTYLGKSDPASASRAATQNDIAPTGHTDLTDLVKATKTTIEQELGRSRFDGDVRDGDVLVGKDSEGRSLVLLLKDDRTVFTYDKLAYIMGDDGMVSAGKNGVAIRGKHGRTLIVTKDGKIRGLECLDSLPEFIGGVVSHAIGDISGHRGRRRHVRIVDDFEGDVHQHRHEHGCCDDPGRCPDHDEDDGLDLV